MNFLPLNRLGPHLNGSMATFAVLLPGISSQVGYTVALRIIHEKDQFIQTEPAHHVVMQDLQLPPYGEVWEVTVDLNGPGSGSHWGEEGEYVYRYWVRHPSGKEIDWVVDPFARQFGAGRQGAITFGFEAHSWGAVETSWKTPRHHDLILYEMNIMEFASSLRQAIERFSYLQDLGINALSLMPVTNVSEVIDWGYTPMGYLGVDDRFGDRSDFQVFVEEAHRHGIAVLVDAIYGHASSLFPYEYLYNQLPDVPNPFMGPFSKDMFGPSVDWGKPLVEDFFYSVNRHWLEVFHIDGFRYDCVPNYWELGPGFRGYASIAYHTYQLVKQRVAAGDPLYSRFEDGSNPLRLVQCAEQLEAVKDVLEQTFSDATWQNSTIEAAKHNSRAAPGALEMFGNALGAAGLPTERTVNGDRLYKSPLQYIENHDHDRFICNFGTENPDELNNPLFERGIRSNWYRVQPYLIGILMAKGIPLLWQGQELCEAHKVASSGASRISFLRLMNWEYFYDDHGRQMLRLVRALTRIRRILQHVRNGHHYFFNDVRYTHKGLLLFARYYPNTPSYTLVALNFSGNTQQVPFWFPVAGDYREELHGQQEDFLNLEGVAALEETLLEIPSNYGRIYTHI